MFHKCKLMNKVYFVKKRVATLGETVYFLNLNLLEANLKCNKIVIKNLGKNYFIYYVTTSAHIHP